MLSVAVEGGLVILDLHGRRRDSLLSCGQAERFCHALEEAAAGAELQGPPLFRGELWACKVESYDGLVALRFDVPFVGAPRRVPLSAGAARKLAEAVRFKCQQAEHKMRFVVGGA